MNAKAYFTAIAMIIATSAPAWGQAAGDVAAMGARHTVAASIPVGGFWAPATMATIWAGQRRSATRPSGRRCYYSQHR